VVSFQKILLRNSSQKLEPGIEEGKGVQGGGYRGPIAFHADVLGGIFAEQILYIQTKRNGTGRNETQKRPGERPLGLRKSTGGNFADVELGRGLLLDRCRLRGLLGSICFGGIGRRSLLEPLSRRLLDAALLLLI